MPRKIEDIFPAVTIPNAAMNEYIKVFITYQLKHYAKETVKTYSMALQCFLSFILVDRNFKFRLADFERYSGYLSQQKQLSPSTIATYLTALRRFCQYLVECKELPRNPAKSILGITAQKTLPTYFNHDELQSLLMPGESTSLHDLRDIAMMHIMLSCFLTEHELHQAQVQDISLDGDYLLVNGLRVTMTKHAKKAIQSYLQLRFGTDHSHHDLPLFESHSNRSKGQSISIRGIRDTLHQRIKKLPIDELRKSMLSAYTFRHTGGCLLAIAGFTDDQIMQRMRLKWKSSAMQYIQLQSNALADGLGECAYLID